MSPVGAKRPQGLERLDYVLSDIKERCSKNDIEMVQVIEILPHGRQGRT